MAQVVNTNVQSINAQRQLNKSQAVSNQAMERLSSGLRINSAKDDAAGLAISTDMTSQIKGITQAVRNANDGVSMAQTAEGSMDEMGSILQRMRELSVQSSNDTNSDENRLAIQEEVDQLHSELDRISETTEFNGRKLLDGSSSSTTLQIGANTGQTMTFSIDDVTTNSLGLNGDLNKGDLNGGRVTAATTGTAATMAINGVAVAASDSASATDIAAAINSSSDESGVTASSYNVVQGDHGATGVTSGMEISVGTGATVTLGATSSMDNLVETINRDVEGVTASVGDDGELLMTNDTGESINIGDGASGSGILGSATTDVAYAGYVSLNSVDDTPIAVTGTATGNAGFTNANGSDSIQGGAATITTSISDADGLEINGVSIGAGDTDTDAEMIAHINSYSDETGVTISGTATAGYQFSAEDGRGVEVTSNAAGQADRTTALTKLGMQSEMGGKSIASLGTNVSTMAGAMSSIDKIDDAINQISMSRAGLGAVQNRLSSTVSNLENVSQNLSASNSRIADADFAAETSKMSKAGILQQAGTSMLAQANASSQSVLSLLG